MSEGCTLCKFCNSWLKKGQLCPLNYTLNNLECGDVPQELKGLSLSEKRCISKLNTFFSLVLLPAFPVSQFGMKGLEYV